MRSRSNAASAAATSSCARSAFASAMASSAALVTPAATCGRARKAASPMIATRPTAMRVVSTSKIGCRNGCGVRLTTASSCGASSVRDASRSDAITSSRTSGGGMPSAWNVPVRVGEQPPQLGRFVGRAIPDEIAAPVAGPQIVVAAGDRIADELLVRRQAEHHGVEDVGMHRCRHRALVDQPAPGDVAGIDRLHLGQHLGAHIGAEAVGADHEVALGGRAVGEMRDDAIAALLDALQLLADVIARRPEISPAACGTRGPTT